MKHTDVPAEEAGGRGSVDGVEDTPPPRDRGETTGLTIEDSPARSIRRSLSDSQLSYDGVKPEEVAVVFDEGKRANSLGSSEQNRRALKDLLNLDYDAPHLRRSSRDWDWLPKKGQIMLKVLPTEVKEVHRKDQQCACSFFTILAAAFVAYIVILSWQLSQARQKPAQSVTLETDPSRATLLNAFPNVLVCYPAFAGEAEWLPMSHTLHAWTKADPDKPELSSTPLDARNCLLIANSGKGRCVFIDASNLTPDLGAPVSDRGLELYVAYIREGAKNPKAIGIIYRGAYITMTNKGIEAWCAQQGDDLTLIEWQEAPMDDYQPGNFSFLPYLAMGIEVNRIIKLRDNYDPMKDKEGERLQYSFVPRTASYHVGSDSQLLHPAAVERVEEAHALNHGPSPNMTTIPAVGRFILTQGGGVVSYEEIDPVDIPSLFGTVAGAWSGLLALFSCVFVTTESGRRRLPRPLRRSFDAVKSWRRNSRSMSGDTADKFSRMRSQSSMALDPGELKGDEGGGSVMRPVVGPAEEDRSRARTRSIRFLDEMDEPPPMEDRVHKLEQALMAVLREPWVPAGDASLLREEVEELRATVRALKANVSQGEGGGSSVAKLV